MTDQKEWFSEWFDSPYYHVLYRNRDGGEAEFFLSNLVRHLGLKTGDRIADLACGKGRHSIYLNRLGFDVTGVDLSARSIAEAKRHENPTLHFEVQDLRTLHLSKKFHVAMNLFTSFGYFKSRQEDEIVIRNIDKCLEPSGLLVIDFMNSEKVIGNLVEHESKHIERFTFQISKWVENDFIMKRIRVYDEPGNELEYTEKVQALTLDDFQMMLSPAFTIEAMFGDYSLNPFKRGISDRLIIIAKKHD